MTVAEPRLLFIGGAHGRTGTSLVRRILLRHPDVTAVAAGETRLLEAVATATAFLSDERRLYSPEFASEAMDALRRHIRDQFGDTVATDEALRRFDRDLDAIPVRHRDGRAMMTVPPADPARLAAATGRLVTAVMSGARGAHTALEKTPSNAQFAGLLHRILPTARLVVMRRDPIDVALSHTRRPWGPGDPLDAARYTRAYVARWAEVRRRLPDGWALEVEHADLVADPVDVIRRVVAFCGLRPDGTAETFAASVVAPPVDRRSEIDPERLIAMRRLLETGA